MFFNEIHQSSPSDNIINEVYFGKTDSILKIEKQLDIFRNKYMGNTVLGKTMVNSDEDLLKFNRLVEDYFGFGIFSLNIIKQPIFNAFTMPIDARFDCLFSTNKNLIANKKTFKFNKKADYCAVVNIYTGLIFNPLFTTPEILAIILHEIGHNFQGALNESQGYLLSSYSILIFLNNILVCITNPSYDNISKTVSNSLSSTNAFMKLDKKFENALRKNKNLFIYINDYCQTLKSIFGSAVLFAADFIDKLTLGILKLPMAVLNLFSSFGSYLSIILNPVNYNNERIADNFVTMYGYANELGSALEKINNANTKKVFLKNSNENELSLFNKIPIISNIYYMNIQAARIISTVFDEHPEDLIRIKDQIIMLEKELEKTDLDPKMRKAIKSDIKLLNDQINKLTESVKSIKDKNLVRNVWYNKLKKHKFVDAKDLIYSNGDENIISYDNTYKAKFDKEDNK